MKQVLAFFILSVMTVSSFAQSYTLITMKQREKENIENFFVDVSKEIFKRSNLGLKIKTSHFIKAQKTVAKAEAKKKMLISPISRSADREDDFDWIVPLEKYKPQFLTTDKTLDISKAESLLNEPVCVLRESILQQQLEELGFTQVKPQIQIKNCFKDLKKGKIRLVFVHGQAQSIRRYELMGGNIDDLVFGASFEEETTYIASSKGAVPKHDREKLENALAAMKADGSYEKLLHKYGQ